MANDPNYLLRSVLDPGSKRTPRRLAITNEELIAGARRGLPARSFTCLRDALELPTQRLASLVHIPLRTLARRKVFKVDESERLLRIARVFARATEVLGSVPEARLWLTQPKKALGGSVPWDYADTEPGCREVEDLLGRIEHGVFV